jgi:AAA+ superfamily predicted ATPase
VEDDILILGQHKSNAEYQKLLQENPWEAVIYLANIGQERQARKLKDALLQVEEERVHQAQKLLEGETLTDGVLISEPDAKGRCIVGVGGTRYDVEIAPDLKSQPDAMKPGREIWVHPKTMAVIKLRDSYIQGEAAPVTEVLDAEGVEDETTSDKPAKDPSGVCRGQRLRLRVKSRQEEIVVEAVPALADLKPAVGDTVRIIAPLGIAFELLTRGRGDVLLGEIPKVQYDDIGGLDAEMAKIRDAIEEPYVHPLVFQRYALQRPRGILLYGPPGCGKTMIAKAIANSLSHQIERSLQEVQTALDLYLGLVNGSKADDLAELAARWRKVVRHEDGSNDADRIPRGDAELRLELEAFFHSRGIVLSNANEERRKIEIAVEQGSRSYFVSIKGPELLSKWVGETESSIRGIFAMARDRATDYTPVVLFFDELESMFSRRGSGISSDVQKTIVPQLLAEIDGIEETRNVIVIGASNRFDLIDPAVLRPGRLDFKIEIPRPNRPAAESILARYLTPDVPFHPGDLLIPQAAQAALGATATRCSALRDCLSAVLDDLHGLSRDLQSAILLTDLYRGTSPPPRKLHVLVTSGIDPEAKDTALETWRKEDGLAWSVVQSTQACALPHDPAFVDGSRCVSAWPIIDPETPEAVWGVLIVGHPGAALPVAVAARAQELAPAIAAAIRARREVADRLTTRTLDLIFHDRSRLVITEKIDRQRAIQQLKREPLTLEKKVGEIMSGAILENIVSRAKRRAVKREIQDRAFGGTGVTWEDLYEAIRVECQEGKDQYIFELSGDDPYGRGQAYHDTDRFHVDVLLPRSDVGPEPTTWLTSKPYVWRRPDFGRRRPGGDETQ